MERHWRRLVEHVYFDAHGTMLRLDYHSYINSPSWRRRKVEYFAHHNRLCRMCGKGKDIHLHHLTYERMGAELDSDLMPLCERCHDQVHRYARERPTLTLEQATLRAIKVAHQTKAKPRTVSEFVPAQLRDRRPPKPSGMSKSQKKKISRRARLAVERERRAQLRRRNPNMVAGP